MAGSSLQGVCFLLRTGNFNGTRIHKRPVFDNSFDHTVFLTIIPLSTIISPNAWWACMNYYLSVIPYLGAVKALGFPPISIHDANPDSSLFCDSYEGCPDVVQPWVDFFSYLNASADSCDSSSAESSARIKTPAGPVAFSPKIPAADYFDFNMTVDMERVLNKLWTAHISSINTGLPLFESKLQYISAPEALFGKSWAGLVELIADAYFPCDLAATNFLQNLLPPRILLDSDVPPRIENVTRLQNRAVILIDSIYKVDQLTHHGLTELWKLLMCTETQRSYGREMIMLGMYRLPVLAVDGIELLRLQKDIDHQNTTCGVQY
jgi:Leg1